jgi:hypothetical protein
VISSSPRREGFSFRANWTTRFVVEVQAGDGVVRLRLLGLLFEADGPAAFAELDHAVALGIVDAVREYRRTDPEDRLDEVVAVRADHPGGGDDGVSSTRGAQVRTVSSSPSFDAP